ncbi:MAG: L,D-transpeptidase family protein [Muribaculaceae bacterium]|nr:L,D-transpeptidase family protein [Muribaculaceae bacterium]
MRKSYIGLLMLIFLAACGGRNSQQDDSVTEGDSILIDESSLILSDSSAVAKNDTAKKEIPQIRFSSAEDLKDYLRKSPDRVAYSNGIIPLIADQSLEYAQKLVNNTHDGFIIVDKSRMKVILYDRYGQQKLSYGMACAKNYGTKHKKADSRTPEGFFTASGIYDSTEWLFTDDDGKTSKKKGQFGPRFIRLSCPNTSQIGIHGTVAPWSIGHRVSHGCIRVTNENILELVKHVEIGMPIIVVPGRKDMEVNYSEGVESVWIPSSFEAVEPKYKKEEPKLTDDTDSITKPETEKTKIINEKENQEIILKDSVHNGENTIVTEPSGLADPDSKTISEPSIKVTE